MQTSDTADNMERTHMKSLRKRVRKQLQAYLSYDVTRDLAMQLWNGFKKFQGSAGRLSIDEFSHVCELLGIGPATIGQESVEVLFRQADVTNVGTVDYRAVLSTIVNNYTT